MFFYKLFLILGVDDDIYSLCDYCMEDDIQEQISRNQLKESNKR